MPDLQKWQTQLLKVNDLDKFQVFAKKIQRLTDGGVSKTAQPESYKEIIEAAQAIADSLTAMGAGSPEKHLHEHAGSAELQVYMAKYRRLVQLLLPYWQGKSVTDCDVGAAIEIQEHIDGMRSARLYMDFENSRYFLEGSEVTLEEAFASGIVDFTRLSKAWLWDSSKGMVEFGVNTPRITYEGLRLEPESTNFLIDSFILSGRAGMQTVGGDLFFGVDRLGAHIHFKQTPNDNYAYKHYQNLDAPDGSHSLTYVSDTTGLSWGVGAMDSLQSVGVVGSRLEEVSYGVYSKLATMQSAGLASLNRGFVKRTSNDTKEPKFYLYQLENYPVYTSPIKTDDVPVTRLPETLTVITDSGFTIEADEGIQVNGDEITGFGYIRKLEVNNAF